LTLESKAASPLSSKAVLAFLVAAVLAVGLFSATSSAQAGGFCAQWISGGGQCYQPQSETGHWAWFTVYTHERAGCVQVVGYYGEPYTSWVCASRESNATAYRPNNNGGYRGTIRNNNSNYGGYFSGSAAGYQ
jgi:hypothetical protein